MTDDTIESLRAKLAEVERERDVAYRKLDSLGYTFRRYEETEAMLVATVEGVERERDAALATCAEMRMALESAAHRLDIADGAFTKHWACDFGRFAHEAAEIRALLARTDLGRGMVAVPRETLERCRRGATTGFSMSSAGDAAWAELARDLDALLDGGKGRG